MYTETKVAWIELNIRNFLYFSNYEVWGLNAHFFAVIHTIIQNRSEEMLELILFPSNITICDGNSDCNNDNGATIGRFNGAVCLNVHYIKMTLINHKYLLFEFFFCSRSSFFKRQFIVIIWSSKQSHIV